MSARERLARRQAELARALAMGAPVPEGFDASRVQAAARALLDKRRRWVERMWPSLVVALGASFASRFEAWALQHPMTVEPHPLADGRCFAESLRTEGPLPTVLAEALRNFDLRWRLLEGGEAVPRRDFLLRLWRVSGERRWRLLLRLPGGRTWTWGGTLPSWLGGMSFSARFD
jgi:hypothetical protein